MADNPQPRSLEAIESEALPQLSEYELGMLAGLQDDDA